MPILTNSLEVQHLGEDLDVIAPDGSEVRLLTRVNRGSMAHFLLQPGQISKAVLHPELEEVWYVLSGTGQIWRRWCGNETVDDLQSGASLCLPAGTHFQFRANGSAPLAIVAVTMPPWSSEDDAQPVDGRWAATTGLPGTAV